MTRIVNIVLVIGLCLFYYVGLIEMAGVFARVGMPWEPYSGKPAWEVFSLSALTNLIQVVVISVFVGIVVVLRFRSRSVGIALLVSAPVTLQFVWSLYAVSISAPFGLWIVYALEFGYLLFTPPILAWLLHRIISN